MNIRKSPYSEEEGGERRAPNKAGPIRQALLIQIKWEWIGIIETYYVLDHGFILVVVADFLLPSFLPPPPPDPSMNPWSSP